MRAKKVKGGQKMLKKKFFKFFMAFVLCITGFLSFSIQGTHAASDRANYYSSFAGGYSLSAHSWFNYTDVQCGANSNIQYSSGASPAIDSISLSYDAYNVSGAKQFSSSRTSTNTYGLAMKTPTGVLEKAVGNWAFKNDGSEWKPIQRIYHCAFTSSSAYSFSTTEAPTSTESAIPNKYKNIINQVDLRQVNNIILEDYIEDIESFTIGNRTLKTTDFKLDKRNQKKGTDFSDGNMKYHNPVKTDYSYISISVPQKVKRDGEYYNIKAHILVNDTNGLYDSVNTSLYIEPVN